MAVNTFAGKVRMSERQRPRGLRAPPSWLRTAWVRTGAIRPGPGPRRSPPLTPDSARSPCPDPTTHPHRRGPGAPADHAEPAIPRAHHPDQQQEDPQLLHEDHSTTITKDRG